MATNTAVYGLYRDRLSVEEAVESLKQAGFRNTDTATPPWSQRATPAWPEVQVPVATRFEQDWRVCSRNVGPFWKPEPSGKPCAVAR